MYPVWEGFGLHSALFIAVIAAFHVLVSHLTVAAAWVNWAVERHAFRTGESYYRDYLAKSARGLLLFAYVYGALAGVGIWFSATAANPRGISTLIHSFVLYWGAEWWFFLIDVVGIGAYYYTLNRVNPVTHLRIAFMLALGGTGTLAVIVGILSFKLTPGDWLQSGESIEGFYNPTFLPQLITRIAVMAAITGAWTVLIASRLPAHHPARAKMTRIGVRLGLGGMAATVLFIVVLIRPALPPEAVTVLASRAVPSSTWPVLIGSALLAAILLALVRRVPASRQTTVAVVCVLALFSSIFGLERLREVARKPDVVGGYIASNQIVFGGLPARDVPDEAAELNKSGVVGTLPFVPVGLDEYQTGYALVAQQCSACHSISGQSSPPVLGQHFALRSLGTILERRHLTDRATIAPFIGAIGSLPYMHPVVGTQDEIDAMAVYLEALARGGGGPDEAAPTQKTTSPEQSAEATR